MNRIRMLLHPALRLLRSALPWCGLLTIAATVASASPSAPRRAPAFDLPARQGRVALESFRGRVVYVDFWASWCGPCRASFPWMARLAASHASDSLVVIAINLDKERVLADAFLEQHPAAFHVAFDPAGKSAEAFQVNAMPTSFLIGRDGTIQWRHAGFDPRQATGLERRISEALHR
jgi:thiol-disulfide isomerase/thioredoxin